MAELAFAVSCLAAVFALLALVYGFRAYWRTRDGGVARMAKKLDKLGYKVVDKAAWQIWQNVGKG